ncbi:MAG: hypothetical protein LBI66_02435 [Burkholderiaceae bacterium]|jgi:hypothetical protein|nr:hypothetical protein [Burkholderiaceae bacterium]
MRSVLMAAMVAAVLTACGGGGGNAGSNPNGGTTQPTVSSVEFLLDKSVITNSGSDSANLTVTALAANRNPVANSTVAVTVDSGIYTPVTTVTDASGRVTGKIEIGGNRANREIRFNLKAGDQTGAGVVTVTGSQIILTSVPAMPLPGQPVQVTAKVSDSNGAGIAGVPVALSGSVLSSALTSQTDTAGIARFSSFNAPATPQVYTLQAKASGVTLENQVTVSGGTSQVPDAVGVVSAASLSIVPNTVKPNLDGGTTNVAQLRALFLDKDNRAIPNMRVRFEIVAPGLGAGESISTGNQTVISNASGIAVAQYIPGVRTSGPTDGINIKMCFARSDAELASYATNCPASNSRTGSLTVASEPVSITIGDNNELEKGANNLTYIKKFDVAVANSSGEAVSGAKVSASVDILRYGFGSFDNTKLAHAVGSGTCLNEDINRNGSLDIGEDANKDGRLTPPKADIVVSYTEGVSTTGANGRMAVQVEYPQNVATWLTYKLIVTSSVAGSEGRAERVFTTGFVEGDEKNGSFLISPYGLTSVCLPE